MRATLARATGLAAAVLLSTLTISATPAGAGGPTSAFLSIPGAGSTASLYYTDPEYDELADLVGIARSTGTFDGEESGGHEAGPGVTVTWLIHDVQVWRVDRIYLGAEGGPWIATQTASSDSIWDSPVLWHRPPEGKRLAALLDELGLGAEASTDTDFGAPAGAGLPEVADDRTARQTAAVAAEAGSSWLERAAWGAGGVLVGGLLFFGWSRRRPAAVPDSAPSLDRSDGYTEVLAR